MELGVLEQGRQFLICLISGLFYGVFYDLLWGLGKDRPILRWITDLLAGIGLFIDNWLLFLYVGDGEYRIFFLIGIFAGFLLWRGTASKYFRKGCSLFWKVFFIPFVVIWRIFDKIIKKMKKFFKNLFSNRKKSVKIKRRQSVNGGENSV